MPDAANFQFSQARTRTLISLTPLIDVVFILLLFFMLASNFSVESSLSVLSADSRNTESETADSMSKLRILEGDTFVLDGEVLDSQALTKALTERYELETSHSLSISVAERTRVQALLDLIALAEEIGITSVSMDSSKP